MKQPASIQRRRMIARLIGGALLLCRSGAQAQAQQQQQQQQQQQSQQAPGLPELATTLPPPQTQQAILRAVRSLPAGSAPGRRYRLAVPFGAPLFPPDDDLAMPPATAQLLKWLSLPPAQRANDLLITPDVDYYWDAEGRSYSCQFIIHIQALEGGRSRVETLQIRPTVRAGKKFDLLGRTGPGFYLDLRPAAPSAQTDAELRAFLAAALGQPLVQRLRKP